MCGYQNLGRHTVCQSCGDAKDASEKYEMPADTRKARTVTQPSLLAIARGGANWRCPYCRSDQRRADGTCRQCGAPSGDAKPSPLRAVAAKVAIGMRWARMAFYVALVGFVFFVLITCGIWRYQAKTQVIYKMAKVSAERLRLPFEDVHGTVQQVKWQHRIEVQRYKKVAKEGFAESRPPDALEVKAAGQRFHHNETVQVGSHTEYYTVTESDGFDTESYTEQEACGQDCTSTPQSCREVCTPNGNGFATCRTSCSGGGQSCTTRYCSVTKYRQVPRTKQVQKSREVPEYGQRAVNQAWFTWTVWEWAPQRTLEKHGTGTQTEWPTDKEVALGKKLGKGEQERAQRVEVYTVVVRTPAGLREAPLPNEAALATHSAGEKLTLRTWPSGLVQLL